MFSQFEGSCDPFKDRSCPFDKFSQEDLDWEKEYEPKRYAVIMEYGGVYT